MASLGGLMNSSEIIPTHVRDIPCPYTFTTSLPETSPHLGLDFKTSATAIQGTMIPSSSLLPPHARPPPNVADL